ncbi:MAG: V-type ATPase subunit [Eubacteriales bacterium]|nr:V-type ATPase subunit [Eubacteriales bacterium]
MPQPSIAYAIGRVRSLARKPLAGAQLERLLVASDYDEARHILTEMGWAEIEDKGVEATSAALLEKNCKLIQDISPQPEVTDSFMLRHDAQNLKALFKARVLEVTPEALSECGTIPVSLLSHAVAEHSYNKLPEPFARAMNDLEKQAAVKVDPMLIDVRVDQALFELITGRMEKVQSKTVREYFRAKADFVNALTYLRMRDMDLKGTELSELLVSGGKLSPRIWKKVIESPDRLQTLFRRFGEEMQAALTRALADRRALPALERAADDYLLALFRPYRNEPFAIEVLPGHLLALEREAAAVRLILAGKRSQFEPELIRERLREAYVQ